MSPRFFSLLAATGLLALPASAATTTNTEGTVVVRGAEASEPVEPFKVDVDLRDLPLVDAWQPGDPIKEIPRRRRDIGARALGVAPEPEGGDPLVDRQLDSLGVLDPTFGTLLLDQNGQGFTGVNPPDPSGDVGGSYYVQGINGGGGSIVVVYNKATGAIAAGPTQMDSLGTGNCATGAGDPIILYDELADRWLWSEFSSSGNRLCVYISQTSDPISGGWFAYSFTAPSFPDYPKYAVWPDAYYVGTNESSPTLYALERADMLAGVAATSQRFTVAELSGFGFQMVAPADFDGDTAPPADAPGLFIRHRDDEAHGPATPGSDSLELFHVDIDWTTPANSTVSAATSISIAEISSNLCGFSTFSCLPQPGSANIDPLREVVMNRPVYRNFGTHEVLVGSLVTNIAANVAVDENAAVRWFELRRTGGIGNPFTLFQEGTYGSTPCAGVCDYPQRWMSSPAMDQAGNIAVAYNFVSDTNNHPGIRYAGRLANDTLGTLPQGEHVVINGTASNSSIRYGDYNHLSLDPEDGCTFFLTAEYNPAASWSTRLASFRFANCGLGIFADGFESGNTTAWTSTVP